MSEHWPVLTIRQPWCWAIEHGKPVENRSWYMKHRGPLWLHAGARSRWDPDGEASPLVQVAWQKFTGPVTSLNRRMGTRNVELHRSNPMIRFGAVTALAEVTGCHHSDECMMPASALPPSGRTGCSPWAVRGQFHIELASVRPLPEPVPCRGMLGLWRLPGDIEQAVRKQLEDRWTSPTRAGRCRLRGGPGRAAVRMARPQRGGSAWTPGTCARHLRRT